MDYTFGGPPLPPASGGGSGSIMASGPEQGFLCFKLGEEEYGIDLYLIGQIVKPPPLTPVPRMPEHVLGVISVRGAVITLVDLRLLMGFEASVWPRTSRVLLVEVADEQIGLLVDAVTQVRRLTENTLEHKPQLDDSPAAERVICIARPDDSTQVTVVDLGAVLAEGLR
jgi:purine-binding chemotaxis protein CheW